MKKVNNDTFEKALSHLDDAYLEEAARGKMRADEKNGRKRAFSLPRRILLIAAAAVLTLAAIALPIAALTTRKQEPASPPYVGTTDQNAKTETTTVNPETTPTDAPSPKKTEVTPGGSDTTLPPLIMCVAMATHINEIYNNLMTDDEKRDLEAFLKEYYSNERIFVDYIDPSVIVPDDSMPFLCCYGKINGCVVWFQDTILPAVGRFDVAGYTFRHPSLFFIKVYRDGGVYDLQKAYETGLLTEQNIADLADIHEQVERVMFGHGFLYDESSE